MGSRGSLRYMQAAAINGLKLKASGRFRMVAQGFDVTRLGYRVPCLSCDFCVPWTLLSSRLGFLCADNTGELRNG